ncbi:Protein of unknown function DUF2219 [Desulfovibrio sp. X2]|uniref:lipid A deacylase LpxR family protein n=1 Tax=Desulfovibrio sp. X2 TaxID=941449 RepID=UPI000358CAD8|nr:lipid A deacylase LpxR family protein [Desulfovibrio sp. X2]EPR42539.1 Protein of unknown function DUF2219 [Desulfovibrio sp. X2]
MRKPALSSCCLCLILLLLPTAARAATLQAQWENDLFADSDKHYTNGAKIILLSDDLKTPAESWLVPQGLGDWLAGLPGMSGRDGLFNVGLAVGQDMYTPDDTSLSDPPTDDRPYAGWLYGSLLLDRKDASWLDTLELTMGMVGPSSHADDAQRTAHNVFGSEPAKGWSTQLHDEFGAMLSYTAFWRALEIPLAGSLGADLIPHFGATIGNVKTYANAGAEFRLGWDLPGNFGITPIGPGSGETTGMAQGKESPTFSIYLFAYVDGQAVAHNIFLDGNTFRSSRHVPKKALVGDAAAGVGMEVCDLFVTFCYVSRSPEFYGDSGQNFGSVTVGYRF